MKFKNVAVVSTAGVIAALAIGAGGAYAATQIGSEGIKDDSVRSIDVKDGTIRLSDLRPGLQAKIAKHAKDGVDGAPGAPGAPGEAGAPGSVAGVQTNWVANPGSDIVNKHMLHLRNEGIEAGTSVEIADLNLAVQAQQTISFTYQLNDGAVYGGGAPRVFVEMQGTYIQTSDVAPFGPGEDNGDGTFTKTVQIGKNGRIGQAGVVKDFGDGAVTITNLTIAGKVLDFQ